MRNPSDAYREGYEKGKRDKLAGNISEIIFGGFQADPGGYYQAGYSDGAAGKKFNPHGRTVEKPTPQVAPVTSSLSDLEKQWYRLCDSSEFIPQEEVTRWTTALTAARCHVAVVIGLSDFTYHACPKCTQSGQFRIHLLGTLKHPDCGWHGYMKTGAYIGHQIMQVLHSGYRAGGSIKAEADKKNDKPGAWMGAILGFLFVGIFRALLAAILIPVHAVAALFQPDQTRADIVARVLTLIAVAIALGIVVYQGRQASRAQTSASPQFFSPQSNMASAPSRQGLSSAPQTNQPAVRPSFDCAKARTNIEILICRDSHLAALELNMVSAYNQALNRVSQTGRLGLRKDHMAWFKNYARTCGQSPNSDERATCVANFLAAHTVELNNRIQ